MYDMLGLYKFPTKKRNEKLGKEKRGKLWKSKK